MMRQDAYGELGTKYQTNSYLNICIVNSIYHRYPHQHKLIHKLEMIQHRAARFVLNQPWSKHYRDSISEMLHKLNWPSLQAKRKQARLIFLFKMLNKQISILEQYLPSLFPVSATRSHHPLKLQQLYTRTDVYHYSFLPRTIPDWNNLCIKVALK